MSASRRTRAPSGTRWLLLVAALVGPAAAFALLRSDAADESDRRCRAALIPGYVSPSAIARLAPSSPAGAGPDRLLVINPASGPGAVPEASYRAALAAFRGTVGTKVLGYVPTSYGDRQPGAVEQDAERYRTWYGVDGIFLDEAAADARRLPYYRALGSRLRAAGVRPLVLNPGRVPAEGYLREADLVVTFEGSYADYGEALRRMPGWLRRQPAGQIAHLVHGASRREALRALESDSGAGYFYFTDGMPPNPWGSLSSYLAAEEEALDEGCA